jgi:hypothetical protein
MIEPTYEELRDEVAELEKHVRVAPNAGVWFKVSEKGGTSLYGLGRFPVTLYYEQWMKLLANVEQLRSFLESNKGALKLKSTKQEPC